MELQGRLEELTASGIGVAAISYDSPQVLAEFAERRSISFPLLSDNDSSVITGFGILNTVAAEGLGANADNPDVVADVAKYVSMFGASSLIVGTPYPGTFMLDSEGVVSARFFEEFYRERNTTSNVMLKAGIGVSPVAAIEGSTAQLKFTAYPSNSSITVGTKFSVAVDVQPEANMHVYAPGAEAMGYRVIGLNFEPNELLRFEAVEFPESEIYHFAPLDEYVPVFQRPFTLLQEIVVDASATAEDIMAEMDTLTLSGTFQFQACDDAICYLPTNLPVSLTLDIDNPDRQRANSR